MFWISGTNPLVRLSDLLRVRKQLTKPDLFVIVQDIFLTETAASQTLFYLRPCGARRLVALLMWIELCTFHIKLLILGGGSK